MSRWAYAAAVAVVAGVLCVGTPPGTVGQEKQKGGKGQLTFEVFKETGKF